MSPFRPRQILAQRMSEFVTNMFQYDVTVGITRSEVIFNTADPFNLPNKNMPVIVVFSLFLLYIKSCSIMFLFL